MGLDVGGRVAIYSPNSVEKMQASIGKTNAEVLLPEDFTVRGIFDVGFPDYNSSVIVASLEDARELLKMPDGAPQALQVKLRDPFLAEEVKEELEKVLPGNLEIYTWREENPDIFNALAVEKNTMFLRAFFHHDCGGVRHRQLPDHVCRAEDARDRHPQGPRRQQPANSLAFPEPEPCRRGAGRRLGFGIAMLALAYRNEFLAFMRTVTHSEFCPPLFIMSMICPLQFRPEMWASSAAPPS